MKPQDWKSKLISGAKIKRNIREHEFKCSNYFAEKNWLKQKQN